MPAYIVKLLIIENDEREARKAAEGIADASEAIALEVTLDESHPAYNESE